MTSPASGFEAIQEMNSLRSVSFQMLVAYFMNTSVSATVRIQAVYGIAVESASCSLKRGCRGCWYLRGLTCCRRHFEVPSSRNECTPKGTFSYFWMGGIAMRSVRPIASASFRVIRHSRVLELYRACFNLAIAMSSGSLAYILTMTTGFAFLCIATRSSSSSTVVIL